MCDTAGQAVCVLSIAQAIDERSQLMNVVHFASHHHLFMDDVGLRQICSLLQDRQVLIEDYIRSLHLQHAPTFVSAQD